MKSMTTKHINQISTVQIYSFQTLLIYLIFQLYTVNDNNRVHTFCVEWSSGHVTNSNFLIC